MCTRFDKKYNNRDYDKRRLQLERIFQKARSKKRTYDCMVPFSGGRDSTMVLYLCTRVYNLRTLAFTFDNGFASEQARKNMEVAVNKFDVDFLRYKPRRSKLMMAYRISFLKTGKPYSSSILATISPLSSFLRPWDALSLIVRTPAVICFSMSAYFGGSYYSLSLASAITFSAS